MLILLNLATPFKYNRYMVLNGRLPYVPSCKGCMRDLFVVVFRRLLTETDENYKKCKRDSRSQGLRWNSRTRVYKAVAYRTETLVIVCYCIMNDPFLSHPKKIHSCLQ